METSAAVGAVVLLLSWSVESAVAVDAVVLLLS
jgi:hypothetical protein